MCLVIYACKCDVPKKQLKIDMQECFEILRKFNHDNELTQFDVDSAMECYSKDYYNFTISDIELLTDLHIERNKRNGRKQADHIKLMNFVRDEINHNTNWRDGNGRPSKKQIVFDWLYQHPFGKKIECERDTQLSRHTVLKWWDICKSEVFAQMDQDVIDFCMEDSYSDDINEDEDRVLDEMNALENEQVDQSEQFDIE